MKKILFVPNGLTQINEVYGNPDKDGNFTPDIPWIKSALDKKILPFPLRLAWDKSKIITQITAHILVIDSIIDALEEIERYKGYEYLKEMNLDLFGGCYHFRKMCGNRPFLSTHSWGIAIDYCPHLGEYGKQPIMPDFIVNAFKARGFEWGGDWKVKDGMHFQACKGY